MRIVLLDSGSIFINFSGSSYIFGSSTLSVWFQKRAARAANNSHVCKFQLPRWLKYTCPGGVGGCHNHNDFIRQSQFAIELALNFLTGTELGNTDLIHKENEDNLKKKITLKKKATSKKNTA